MPLAEYLQGVYNLPRSIPAGGIQNSLKRTSEKCGKNTKRIRNIQREDERKIIRSKSGRIKKQDG
jgi:hypothetical protein